MNLDEDIFCNQCETHIADFEVFADVRSTGDGTSAKTFSAHLNLCELCIKEPKFPIVTIVKISCRPKPDGVA